MMDTRNLFCVDEHVKHLAQQRAESQQRTLDDACRTLTEQSAEQLSKVQAHNVWLVEQVNQAFNKLDAGKASFVDCATAQTEMVARKTRIRNKQPQ